MRKNGYISSAYLSPSNNDLNQAPVLAKVPSPFHFRHHALRTPCTPSCSDMQPSRVAMEGKGREECCFSSDVIKVGLILEEGGRGGGKGRERNTVPPQNAYRLHCSLIGLILSLCTSLGVVSAVVCSCAFGGQSCINPTEIIFSASIFFTLSLHLSRLLTFVESPPLPTPHVYSTHVKNVKPKR